MGQLHDRHRAIASHHSRGLHRRPRQLPRLDADRRRWRAAARLADMDPPHRPNQALIPRHGLKSASAHKEHAMERPPVFLNCPAYLDNDGAIRCGLPAEVEARYTVNSTDGPLESAKIKCPR